MQSVLSLDLSVQPVDITLTEVKGSLVDIKQHTSVSLPLLAEHDLLTNPLLAPAFLAAAEILRSFQDSGVVNGEPTYSSGEDEDPETSALKEKALACIVQFREALKAIKGEYSSTVITIAPLNSLAFNLKLPFGDEKSLSRIVDLEVQDLVPFELDEFVVQYKSLGSFPDGDSTKVGSRDKSTSLDYDVHIGLAPRVYIRNILALCEVIGIEPMILTTPSSALGAVYQLGSEYFKGNSAIVLARGNQFAVVCQVSGMIRVEHTLHSPALAVDVPSDNKDTVNSNLSSLTEEELVTKATALKLIIAGVERRYGSRIETVHLLGTSFKPSMLQQILARPVETFTLKDVIKSANDDAGISALPAVFATDFSEASALTNFRTREFSFRPKFLELVRVLALTWQNGVIACLSVLVALAALYGVRQYQLNQMKSFIIEKVQSVIPNFDPGDSKISAAVRAAEQKLSTDLGVLGSPAKISPLDVYISVHDLIPADLGVTLTGLKVSGSKALLTGVAPDLSAIEKLGKIIERGNSEFSKVVASPGSANGARFNFTVDISLAK